MKRIVPAFKVGGSGVEFPKRLSLETGQESSLTEKML
jgi:hypothetical protein